MKDSSVQQGHLAEQTALEFLLSNGLNLVTRNFRSRTGEIDLIMLENSTIVFIEVRSRASNRFMEPIETINHRKIQKIIRTSRIFLQQYKGAYGSCRFDIITLTGKIKPSSMDWIKNAFFDE